MIENGEVRKLRGKLVTKIGLMSALPESEENSAFEAGIQFALDELNKQFPTL